jgi:hypothetical protein
MGNQLPPPGERSPFKAAHGELALQELPEKGGYMTNKIKIAAGFLGLGLLLSACNGGDGATAVNEGDLIGKWLIRSDISSGYMRATDPTGKEVFKMDLGDTNTYTGSTYFFDFKADHTYTANTPNYTTGEAFPKAAGLQLESGTWSVSGADLTLIGSETGATTKDTVTVQAAIDGTNATFSLSIDEKETTAEGSMEMKLDAVMKAVKE